MTPLFVHAGYPKTATTTFQQHVFPHHPDIEYLGKFIPSFQYVDESLYPLIDELVHMSAVRYRGTVKLRAAVEHLRQQTTRRCVLLSSESFIHPSTIDIAVVADRLHDAFAPCKILITIREQVSAILSFYRMHGRYGQYLTITSKEADERISYPISFPDWISYQIRAQDCNYIGTLHYDSVVRYYVKKFGPENVRVLLYEALQTDRSEYLSQLGEFLGVDASTFDRLIAGKHELRSKEYSAAGDASINEESATDSGDTSFAARVLKAVGLAPDSKAFVPSADELNEVREMYRAGNAWLAREMALPLQRYGYIT